MGVITQIIDDNDTSTLDLDVEIRSQIGKALRKIADKENSREVTLPWP